MMWFHRQMAILALAAFCVATPRVGRAEAPEKPVAGPMLVCLKHSTFQLAKGERIADVSAGPEMMDVIIQGPTGIYTVEEGEIFAAVQEDRRLVRSSGGTRIYRLAGQGPRYAAYGRTSFSDGHDAPVAWLAGAALNGASGDAAIYRRIQVRNPAKAPCGRRFSYGWEIEQIGR